MPNRGVHMKKARRRCDREFKISAASELEGSNSRDCPEISRLWISKVDGLVKEPGICG